MYSASHNRRRSAPVLLLLAVVVVAGAFAVKWQNTRTPAPSGPMVAWAKKHAIPIKTVEAQNGFGDLQPLKLIVGRSRVVGMGEATHGTREFFQFKHRMFEFLVQEMGFTAIAFEAGFPQATKLNDYVLGGGGDGPTIVRKVGTWLWNTEEVVSLVEWMRDYNLRPSTVHKVKFYGFDMQEMEPALREALTYLKTVDAEQWLSFQAFAAQAEDFKPGKVIARQKLVEAKATLRRLLACFDTHQARFTETGGGREWRHAVQNTRVALQSMALLENDKDDVRDAAMAENVQWILREEGAAGRIMLWAHNAHLSHPPEVLWGLLPADMTRAFTPMGTRLRKIMGPDYTAFGFAFNQGGFRAQPVKTDAVGPASADSLDAVLACTGMPIFVLDVRPLPDDPDAAKWLRAVHPARSISAYGGRDDQTDIVVQDCYDALVFFDRTTASRRQNRPRRRLAKCGAAGSYPRNNAFRSRAELTRFQGAVLRRTAAGVQPRRG